ncbi:GNAT family N-acetyltransferase [Jeongeupia chitinilytica]|uniref:GNAT family N-acetyltransferase n=1 Tax=Jeongeupia chitinilytica TaxID=1041641 RepID=UPI001679B370|nr:GNAT family N-acetyltransferase [Jeongeupia chitinilytica]
MSDSPVCIRRAGPADAAGIQALYAELVGHTDLAVQPERIEQVSRDASTALFVAEVRGVLCGSALVSLCNDVMFRSQPFAVVENVIVTATHRGVGIGRLLFAHIEAFCLKADCSKIMLLSSIERAEAHRFFERVGFAGTRKRGFVKYRRHFSMTPSHG